jgi:uncharacterized membrane protein YagU involved in acid resistance
MHASSIAIPRRTQNPFRAILLGGLIAGVLDISAAFLLSAPRHIPPPVILRGIASGLLGKSAFQGGVGIAILGAFLHFVIAFGAAAVYVTASRWLPILTRQSVLCGLLYGIVVYLVMNEIVLPLSAFPFRGGHPSAASILISVAVLMLVVGLPISLSARRYAAR